MKQILFILSQRPGSAITAQESFDAVLAGSAFSEVSVLFIGDGALQLMANLEASKQPHRKAFNQGFTAMADYEIRNVYCCETSFHENGLSQQDLCITPVLVRSDAISKLWQTADGVLCF